MRIPVTTATFVRLAFLTSGSVVFAFAVPTAGDSAARGIVPAIALFAAGTVLVLLAEALHRRAKLLEAVRTELNKLRRIYHLGKNLAGDDDKYRVWFTDLHGYIHQYLAGFADKSLDHYDMQNTSFRLVSYHVYTVPELDTRKREALFKDLLTTTAAVSEARQQIKELWDGRLSAYGWTSVLLMTFAFVVSTLLSTGPTDPARITAGVAISAMLIAVDLLWEADTMVDEKRQIMKSYVENMGRLELGRRR